MTDSLATTFTPTYKDTGDIDRRYSEDMRVIFESAGHRTLTGLQEFKDAKLRLENKYGTHAYKLAIAFIQRIEYIDETERWDSSTNSYKWRSKGLLARLREGLTDLGYEAANVSTVIGAAEYIVSIEPREHDYNSDLDGTPEQYALEKEGEEKFYNWSKGLSMSAQYELRRTDKPSIQNSYAWQELKELSSNFSKSITRKDLRDVRKRHPKDENKKLPGGGNFDAFSDDPSPLVEIIETQEDIQNKFFHYMSLVDMEAAYVDDSFKKKLLIVSERIEILNSWLPNQIRPSLSTII
jgi:hypothetical protein